MPILTCQQGDSADIFSDILKLYADSNSKIIDLTYGKGVFWKKVDKTSFYSVTTNDLLSQDAAYHDDFRRTGWPQGAFDVVVFDPPYATISSNKRSGVGDRYNNNLNGLKTIDDLIALYEDGITEARRLLKINGILIVKCMDQISGGKQRRIHFDVWKYTTGGGVFIDEDMFILMQKGTPTMRHSYQLHARKNNSFFLVFRKKNR